MMRATGRAMKLWLAAGLVVFAGACLAPEQRDPTATLMTGEELRAATSSVVDKGSIAFGESIRDISLFPGDRHGFTFYAKEGAIVRATQTAHTKANPDGFLVLLGPPAGPQTPREVLTWDDNSGGHSDALVDDFRIPASGEYQLIATSFHQRSRGMYTLSLFCLNSRCSGPPLDGRGPTTYDRTRTLQDDICQGRVTAAEMFRLGDFLFDHPFTVEEGFGNGLRDLPGRVSEQPNLRRVHWRALGGPDATNCSNCHGVGGNDGAGDGLTNVFQDGDGENTNSALERNAPALLGVGYIEKLADEMTRELQRQVASARRRARMSRRSRTVALTAKGIAFGLLRIEPDGQRVDYSGMQGVDQDLVVKPFGWKGHTASLRRFVDNALQTHLGIQTVAAVARHCRDPHPELMGSGLDCEDPDSDGVRAEFTEGQLTALSVYLALEQIPIRVMPTDPLSLRRAGEGQVLFGSLGCISCHVRELPLDSPVHVEVPDLTPGPSYRVDLTVDGREPRLRRGHDGRLTVELWSDLKRHRMGPELADPHVASFAPQIPRDEWLTRPLWGVGVTAPYLHDGRAPTLRDAIVAHGGEAAAAQANFQRLSSDEQEKVVDFLRSLARDPDRRGS
ncbi:MAG: hypothetical protein E6J69_08955 [Deltaproteobacteria bacterium]|nr:MAG: hypothetical protein E6J69_08955 [Deltaproteobacteria bacterium]